MFAATDVPACEGREEGGEARHEEQVVGGVAGEAEHGGGQQHDHHHRDAVQGLQGGGNNWDIDTLHTLHYYTKNIPNPQYCIIKIVDFKIEEV